MKISEFLTEKSVTSSWISDLFFNRPNRVLTLRLKNGRTYSIPNTSRYGFDRWSTASSPGKYYHAAIRGKKQLTRIR